ncbi:MAG TPA: hypothetical protein VM580_13720, partial [Labilithrix sp.]|nr:hypothetical protein [Labilithrix sp.]
MAPSQDPAYLALYERLRQLAAGDSRPSSDAEVSADVTQVEAVIDALEKELTTLRAESAEARQRAGELNEMILELVSSDYRKRTPVGGKDDAYDAMALGLNMLAEELGATTVT